MWWQNFFTAFMATMQEIVGGTAAQAAAYARPGFLAAAACFLMYGTVRTLDSPQPAAAFGLLFWQLFLILMLFSVTLNPALYQSEIAAYAWEGPREWMRALARQSGTDDPAVLIDRSIAAGFQTADAFSVIGAARGVFAGWSWQVASWLVIGCTIVMGYGSGAILISASMTLALAISVGPIFGSFLAFQLTRGMGTAWTGTMIAPGLSIALGSIVLMVTFKFWNQAVVTSANDAALGVKGATQVLGVGLTSCVLIGVAATLGYALGRGVQPALAGFLGNSQRAAMSFGNTAAGWAAKLRPRNMAAAGNRLRQDAAAVSAAGQFVARAWRGRP